MISQKLLRHPLTPRASIQLDPHGNMRPPASWLNANVPSIQSWPEGVRALRIPVIIALELLQNYKYIS